MGSIPPAVSMEFITTIRGARSLLHQGYRYTLNRRTADGQTYWRCQAATEVSIMQLAAGGLSIRRRRKYRLHEKRLATIKEKYEAGDYTLSEFLKAHSHWVSF